MTRTLELAWLVLSLALAVGAFATAFFLYRHQAKRRDHA